MNALRALSISDFKNINRDSLLKFIAVYPLALGVAMRWLIPWVAGGLADLIDASAYYPLLAGFFGILIIPQLFGCVTGFMLLDERDDNTLTALMVTPLPLRRYMLYRLGAPVLAGILGVLIVVPLMNIVAVAPLRLLAVGLAAGLGAPIFALLLASFARNKVEGLALMKGMGILLLAPFAAWFVPMPWQWLLGVFPTYWPVKAFWVAEAGEPWFWLYVVIGFTYAALWVLLMQRRLDAVLRR